MKEKITLNNIIKLSIILTVLMLAFSILWIFVITPYKNRKNLDSCLKKAGDNHELAWKEACRAEKSKIEQDGSCSLHNYIVVKRLDESFKDRRDACFKRYPIK